MKQDLKDRIKGLRYEMQMHKIISILLVLSFILPISPARKVKAAQSVTPYAAETESTDGVLMTIGGGTAVSTFVNIRSEADAGSTTLEQTFLGDTFLVTGKTSDGEWYEILYQGGKAYVNAHYIRFGTRVTSPFRSAGEAVTADKDVALLEDPKDDANVLTTFAEGASLTITGVWNEYLAVKAQGLYGYVRSTDVAFSPLSSWNDGSNLKAADIQFDEAVAQKIWHYFSEKGLTEAGIAGLMGNLFEESRLLSNNLENWAEKLIRMKDVQYTEAVNNGKYSKDDFCDDAFGYGLCQWTMDSRKEGLYERTVEKGLSIDDLDAQLDYLWEELNDSWYKHILDTLKVTNDIREATYVFMCDFENPANQRSSAKRTRLTYSLAFMEHFMSGEVPVEGNAMVIEETFLYQHDYERSRKMELVKEGSRLDIETVNEDWAQLTNGLWIKVDAILMDEEK